MSITTRLCRSLTTLRDARSLRHTPLSIYESFFYRHTLEADTQPASADRLELVRRPQPRADPQRAQQTEVRAAGSIVRSRRLALQPGVLLLSEAARAGARAAVTVCSRVRHGRRVRTIQWCVVTPVPTKEMALCLAVVQAVAALVPLEKRAADRSARGSACVRSCTIKAIPTLAVTFRDIVNRVDRIAAVPIPGQHDLKP